jgi:hypothetical protein
MVPVYEQSTELKLERKQNYVAVPGFFLRDIDDFKRTNKLTGNKIGHVLFDQAATLFLETKLDLLYAEALLNHKI